jgi:hypothetical protein
MVEEAAMKDDRPMKMTRVVEGEVVRGGSVPVQRRTLTRLVSRLSTFPFFNRMSKRAIDSATEVFEAQTRLGQALSENQRMGARLDDMPTIIADDSAARKRDFETREAERLEAAARRARAQAAYEERFTDKQISQQTKDQAVKLNKIAEVDLDIQLYNKMKEFESLQKPPPEPPKKKTTRGRSEKQKLREKAQKCYETEVARIEGMNATAKTKANLIKAEAQELEKKMEEIEKMP